MIGRSRSGGPGVFVVSDSTPAPPDDREIRWTDLYVQVALSIDPIFPPAPATPCTGGGTVNLAADPAQGTDLDGSKSPLKWVSLHLDAGDRVYADLPLPDPTTYHSGYKEPRILSMSRIRRAMSDRFGGLQTASIEIVLADTDRVIRGRMAAETFLNREFEVWMADDSTRRAVGAPRRIGHYVITNYEPIGDFTFRISGADFIGSEVSKFWSEQPIDLPAFSRIYFPQLSQDLEGTPIPPYYGFVSDESLPTSADGPVILDAEQGIGGEEFDSATVLNFGWADDLPGAPVDLTLGTTPGGDFEPGTYYMIRTAVVDGVESLPYPLDGEGLTVTLPGPLLQITGTGAAVTGATAYRWYLSDVPVATHAHINQTLELVKETASPSVTFQGPTDGVPYLNAPFWAVVIARMPDGVTIPQRSTVNDTGVPQYEGFVKTIPYADRPVRIGWEALPGAAEYWVYIRGAIGGYTTRFIVPVDSSPGPTFFDYTYGMLGERVTGLPGSEAELGAVPARYVGQWVNPDGVTREAFVLAFGTLGNIQSLFGSDGQTPTPVRKKIADALYGVSVFAPYKNGWLYPTNYVEVTSSEGEKLWLTMIFVDPSHPIALAAIDGTIEITGNVCGWTTDSDGTGGSISSGPRQVLHLLTNLGPSEEGPWRSGDWKQIPVRNGVPVYRSSSFEAVKTQTESLVDGGFECAWGIGVNREAPKLFDFLSAAAINLGIRWATNEHGQLLMRMLDTNAASAASFTDSTNIPNHIVPVITPATQDLITRIRYVFKENYIQSVTNQTPGEAELLPPQLAETPDWYSGFISVIETASEAAHRVRRPLDVQFGMHRDGRAPAVVVARLLAMLAWPLNRYQIPASLLGLDITLGDVISVTLAAGAGASGATNRRIYFDAVDIDPQMTLQGPTAFDTVLEGDDITDLVL